jgi:hypothetical protein
VEKMKKMERAAATSHGGEVGEGVLHRGSKRSWEKGNRKSIGKKSSEN